MENSPSSNSALPSSFNDLFDCSINKTKWKSITKAKERKNFLLQKKKAERKNEKLLMDFFG